MPANVAANGLRSVYARIATGSMSDAMNATESRNGLYFFVFSSIVRMLHLR